MRALALLALLTVGAAPAPFDPQALVTEALRKTRAVAYNRDKADWAAIEARARGLAMGAKDSVDLLPAYLAIMVGLKDNHSWLRPSQAQMDGWQARYGDRRLLPEEPRRRKGATRFAMRGKDPTLTMVAGKRIAHVVVPSVDWDGKSTSAPYGNRLWSLVAASAGKACGYLVDLRNNTGGDQYPMMSGVGALLGDGLRTETAGPDGRRAKGHAYQRDAEWREREADGKDELLNRVEGWRPLPALARAPVAVLTDGATASSGEGVTLAFKGRPRTRSFGARTYGVASSNEWVTLSDGAVLLVTAHMMLDRRGRAHPDGVAPDEPVAEVDGRDAPLAAATTWLDRQPGCRRH